MDSSSGASLLSEVTAIYTPLTDARTHLSTLELHLSPGVLTEAESESLKAAIKSELSRASVEEIATMKRTKTVPGQLLSRLYTTQKTQLDGMDLKDRIIGDDHIITLGHGLMDPDVNENTVMDYARWHLSNKGWRQGIDLSSAVRVYLQDAFTQLKDLKLAPERLTWGQASHLFKDIVEEVLFSLDWTMSKLGDKYRESVKPIHQYRTKLTLVQTNSDTMEKRIVDRYLPWDEHPIVIKDIHLATHVHLHTTYRRHDDDKAPWHDGYDDEVLYMLIPEKRGDRRESKEQVSSVYIPTE